MTSLDDKNVESAKNPDDGVANFRVWGMVEVQRRAWPGINKPGGIGRVTRLHSQEQDDGTVVVTHVDVHYVVLGRRERGVPVQFVKPRPDYDIAQSTTTETKMGDRRNNLRDRSMLLGRCNRCGSLRRDCGSCDWRAQEKHRGNLGSEEEAQTNLQETLQSKLKRRQRIFQEQDIDDSSSSSSDEYLQSLSRKTAHFRKYQREKRHCLRTVGHESSDDSRGDGRAPVLSRVRRPSSSRRKESNLSTQNDLLTRRRKRHSLANTIGRSSLERVGDKGLAADRMTANEPEEQTTPHDSISDARSPDFSPMPNSVALNQQAENVEDVGDSDSQPSQHKSLLESPVDSPSEGDSEYEAAYSQTIHLDDFLQSLDDFIQPEGARVAENLPRDTQDKTASLWYGELPAFFDRTVARLETSLPNAESRVKILQNRLKTAESKTEQAREEMRAIEIDSSELFYELKQLLIRDGIDQCQRVMHRLRNRNERRLHKSNLTREQNIQCGTTSLDMRDMRLDMLSNHVEQTMQDLRGVLVSTGARAIQDESDSHCNSLSGEDSGNPSTPDVSRQKSMLSTESLAAGDDMTLPPFDPHMHASKVRHKRLSKRKRRKKAPSKSRASKRTRKVSKREDETLAKVSSNGRGFSTRRSKPSRRRRNADTTEEVRRRLSDGTESASDSSLSRISEPMHERDSTMSNVPPLESILSFGDTKRSRSVEPCAIPFVGENARSDHVRIADRMQAFLDANSSNVQETGWNTSPEQRAMLPSKPSNKDKIHSRIVDNRNHSQTREIRRRETFSEQTSTHPSPESSTELEVNHDGFVSRYLYHSMLQRKKHRAPLSTTDNSKPRCIRDLCSGILENYPGSTPLCWSAFGEISNCFKPGTEVPTEEASQVFKTILGLLEKHGIGTLQEVLHRDGRFFQTHVRFVSCVLVLIDRGVHEYLKPEDGVVYSVFNASGVCPFVESMTIQCLDVVYSQLLPAAWGTKDSRSRDVLDILSPLRDALGRITPLLEAASRFIATKLECQQWWVLEGEPPLNFVSSVNPQHYALFLTDGVNPTPSTAEKTRFKSFKDALPRSEIDAAWSLLAYFSETTSRNLAETNFRWRLVLALLFSKAGVLGAAVVNPSSGSTEHMLPPSRDHVLCCEKEIGYITALLSVGAMDPIPPTDGLVIKLVQGALTLQVDEYKFNPKALSSLFPPLPTAADFHLTLQLWDEANPCASLSSVCLEDVPFSLSDCFLRGSVDLENDGTVTIFKLLPFGLLRNCISFLVSWVQRIPEKKARLSRLSKKILELVAWLEKRALCVEHQRNSDEGGTAFEDAFAENCSKGSSFQPDLVYRESACHLLITLAASTVARSEPIAGTTAPAPLFTEELRKKVWDMLSDNVMKERRRKLIGENINHLSDYHGSALWLYTASKALAVMAFLDLGVPSLDVAPDCGSFAYSSSLISGSSKDENSLVFLVSGMVACLDCACDLISGASHQCPPLTLPSTSFMGTEAMIVRIRIIACICIWLCKIFWRSRVILASSFTSEGHPLSGLSRPVEILESAALALLTKTFTRVVKAIVTAEAPGPTVEICFRACLAVIRSTLGITGKRDNDGDNLSSILHLGDGDAVPERNLTQPTSPDIRSSDSDFFGDIDDHAFLNIDINDIDGCEKVARTTPNLRDSTTEAMVDLFLCLSSSLDLAKPSKRYAILPQACVGVSGRTAIARQAGGVCSTLASLCILNLSGNKNFTSAFKLLINPTSRVGRYTSKDDFGYMLQIAQCFSSELSSVAGKYSICTSLLQDNIEAVFFNLLDAMLDVGTLEKFPSGNVEGIRANGGNEHKARRRLRRVNRVVLADAREKGVTLPAGDSSFPDIEGRGLRIRANDVVDCPGPCYNSRNLWSFCRDLGYSMFRMKESSVSANGSSEILASIGGILLESDSDFIQDTKALLPLVSLERECLKRLKKLRGILSATARTRYSAPPAMPSFTFEKVSSVIFGYGASHLLSCSEGLQYCKLNLDDGQVACGTREKENCKYATLLELQRCYGQMTIALFSWMLRESHVAYSEVFRDLLRFVRDSFLARVLQRDLNVQDTLNQLSSMALPKRASVTNITGVTFVSTYSSSCNTTDSLLDVLNEAVIRRSRELMIHVASRYRPGGVADTHYLFNALMAMGTSTLDVNNAPMERSYLVGRCFRTTRSETHTTARDLASLQPYDLLEAIDSYFSFVEVYRETHIEEIRAVYETRHFALSKYILPKLSEPCIEPTKKLATFRLLRFMLDLETKPPMDIEDLDSWLLDSILRCSFAHEITLWLRECLAQSEVANDLVCELLQCATSLASLPKERDNVADEQVSLLCWSNSNCAEDTSSSELSGEFVTSDTLCATYFSVFASWLRGISEALASPASESTELIKFLRLESWKLSRKGTSHENNSDHSVPKRPDFEKNMRSNAARLEELDRMMFSGKENTPSVTNVYKRPRNNLSTVSDDVECCQILWTPNDEVRQAAQSFNEIFQ